MKTALTLTLWLLVGYAYAEETSQQETAPDAHEYCLEWKRSVYDRFIADDQADRQKLRESVDAKLLSLEQIAQLLWLQEQRRKYVQQTIPARCISEQRMMTEHHP